MAKYTDRSQLIRMWAVENFVGHWDGYTGPLNNNYFIRSNTSGKFVMLPWGADQTFGENRQTKVLLDDYFYPMDKPQSGFPWVQQALLASQRPMCCA
jgi:spore coat protein CotH